MRTEARELLRLLSYGVGSCPPGACLGGRDGGIYEFAPMETSTAAAALLENTRWKLTHLDDRPVGPTAREPHFIFEAATPATMMACMEGMETERAFLDALERVRAWRISGSQLQLLDAAGTVLARFEARQSE